MGQKYVNSISPLCVTLLLSVFLLSACGGGEENESKPKTTQVQPVVTAPVVTAPVVTAPVKALTITELIIAADHNLTSVYQLSLVVDISSYSTARAFISVCENNDQEIIITQINYADCLVQSPLTLGKFAIELTLPNHVQQLVGVIWFTDLAQPAQVQHWSYVQGGGSSWRID